MSINRGVCYCSFIDAICKNWEVLGLEEFFPHAAIVQDEDNTSPDGPYAVFEEIASNLFFENCDANFDRTTYVFTAHCSNSSDQLKQLGTRMRRAIDRCFNSIATDCGDIKSAKARKPVVRRTGYTWTLRLQFNVDIVTLK